MRELSPVAFSLILLSLLLSACVSQKLSSLRPNRHRDNPSCYMTVASNATSYLLKTRSEGFTPLPFSSCDTSRFLSLTHAVCLSIFRNHSPCFRSSCILNASACNQCGYAAAVAALHSQWLRSNHIYCALAIQEARETERSDWWYRSSACREIIRPFPHL